MKEESKTNSFLEYIFQLLNKNISFPYYQAERRIDIFINFFIEDIIRQKTRFKDAKFIAPEFPLKKSTATDHAAHIDYLMYSPATTTMLLVELKTDDISYKPAQILFYLKHPHFDYWFKEFDKIKMKKYQDKKMALKDKIIKAIGEQMDSITNEVIVLKPTYNEKDYKKLETVKDLVTFIQLKDIEITTEFQSEWETFKRTILLNLRAK